MYKVSYAEIMDDDCRTARGREQAAFDRAIELMRRAEAKDSAPQEMEEAVAYIQRLWTFFIESLCDPDNQLPAATKDNLIAVGLWAISEADGILADRTRSFAPLIDINTTIRDGLS